MPYQFLNGYGAPRVVIQEIATNSNVNTIDLDLCMIDGLMEEYEEDFKRVTLEYNSKIIDYNYRGSKITFHLDYDSYCSATNLMNIDLIHAYISRSDEFRVFLQPRTVASGGRVFEVRLSGDSWSQGMHKGGSGSIGHKGVKISFITAFPVSKNFSDTNTNINLSFFHFMERVTGTGYPPL